MKSTTFAILATALASVCSAAPTASAAALPAKFTLSYVPVSGTALPAAGGAIVSQQHYGFSLILSEPTTSNDMTVVTLTGSDSSAFVHHPEFTLNFDWFFSMANNGAGDVALHIPVDIAAGNIATKGLGSVNGGLTWDFADGKGPQSLWSACKTQGAWSLFWAKASVQGCVKVDLKINAL